jgi:serine/threonine protein kinase
MQHPNILPVYDTRQQEGITYHVTPFMEAGSLHDQLTRFYDPRQAMSLVEGVVAGLDYLYSQGMVHGNLKPSNIFLGPNNQPLLADFGSVPLPGSPPTAYKSPEQVMGGAVDRRTDVYALGVLFYEMLVGEAPPVGAVVSPRAKRPDLPESVERLILKAMAQNPEARFQTPGELQAALAAAIQPEVAPASAPAPAVSQSVQVEQPKGTNWVAIILGVLLVGALCLGAAIFLPDVLESISGATPAAPIQPAPSEQPPEKPPEQPPEQPPQEPPAAEQPPAEGGGGGLPFCSSGGFALGILFLGVAINSNRKWKNK